MSWQATFQALLHRAGYQLVPTVKFLELRRAANRSLDYSISGGDLSAYEHWFTSVFNNSVPRPGALIATSWSPEVEWGRRAHSALVGIEVDYVEHLLREIRADSVEGVIMEFGIFEGWWVDKLCEFSEDLGLHRDVYGFDSFEGLPAPSPESDDPFWRAGQYLASYEEVSRRLRVDRRPSIHLVKGWFRDTLRLPETLAIKRVAYARIDSDIYESAVDCLNYLADRLSDKAILVFDDWPHRLDIGEGKAFAEWLPGVPQLTFEFLFYNTWGHLYLRAHRR